jgi:nitrite reductase (NADH) small subunit
LGLAGGRVTDEENTWRRIGNVDEFPAGTCRILTIGEHEVGVYNLDGSFYAIRNYCPHKGAPICKGSVGGTMLPSGVGEYKYGLEGRVIHCPWHQWAFDIVTGRALFGIDRSRLICHAVIRRGNDLFLDERIRKRGAGDADALAADDALAAELASADDGAATEDGAASLTRGALPGVGQTTRKGREASGGQSSAGS